MFSSVLINRFQDHCICIQICMNKSQIIADSVERLFNYGVFINGSKIQCICMFS